MLQQLEATGELVVVSKIHSILLEWALQEK